MKNILIIGIGRAGKTTLSNMLKNKYEEYNLIHSDSLKWAMIRAEGKEEYYRSNIDKQKEFEQSEYFQKTLLELLKSLINNDDYEHGYILESGQLTLKIVSEMIDLDNTIVVCLGLGDYSADDMVNLCLKYDTENDWSYGLPIDILKSHANNWFNQNEILKNECQKYGIKYYDTSKNRVETLNNILAEIEKQL